MTAASVEPVKRVLARCQDASGRCCAISAPKAVAHPNPSSKRNSSDPTHSHLHESCGEALRPIGFSRRLRDAKSHIYLLSPRRSTGDNVWPRVFETRNTDRPLSHSQASAEPEALSRNPGFQAPPTESAGLPSGRGLILGAHPSTIRASAQSEAEVTSHLRETTHSSSCQ
jgi:hypothetical protein